MRMRWSCSQPRVSYKYTNSLYSIIHKCSRILYNTYSCILLLLRLALSCRPAAAEESGKPGGGTRWRGETKGSRRARGRRQRIGPSGVKKLPIKNQTGRPHVRSKLAEAQSALYPLSSKRLTPIALARMLGSELSCDRRLVLALQPTSACCLSLGEKGHSCDVASLPFSSERHSF